MTNDSMTPERCAAEVKDAVGGFGFAWMSDAGVRERGREQLGLRGRALYHLGRCGVLGDASVDTVVAAEAFFPPAVVREHWEQGRAQVEPAAAAAWYSGACQDAGRACFADDEATARLAALVERAVDSVDAPAMPLFAGWRALPRPDDAPGRLGLLLNVLREHRGSVHAAAVAVIGLHPLAAVVAGSYGEANARFFEWPEPYPPAAEHRAAWEQAERLTCQAAAGPYAALEEDERVELVALTGRLLGPA